MHNNTIDLESRVFANIIASSGAKFMLQGMEMTAEEVSSADGLLPAFQALASLEYKENNTSALVFRNAKFHSLGYELHKDDRALLGVVSRLGSDKQSFTERSLYMTDALSKFFQDFHNDNKIFKGEDLIECAREQLELMILETLNRKPMVARS